MANRRTFWGGFLRGLAAPAELFRLERAPALPPPSIEVRYRDIEAAIGQDWDNIGRDMRAVFGNYEEDPKQSD